jgi:hypothetical protein
MAHDFLGTFNKSQWDRFLAFARAQLPLVEDRITHLEAEAARIGEITFAFDGNGDPAGFTAGPAASYLGKLLAAYEVLGGSPPHDLRTRLKSQPVFLVAGDDTRSPTVMSNGEAVGERGLADGLTAEMSRLAQEWLFETMDWRFGRLERKIRRALDYKDQLEAEIGRLNLIRKAVDVPESLEALAADIEQIFADPNYRAIYADQGDAYGRNVRAPFSSYDVIPSGDPNLVDRENVAPQRQNIGGYVGPGQKGTA